MQRRLVPSASVFAVLAIVITGCSEAADPPRGFADPLLGRWNLTVHAADGDYPSWLEVRLRTERQLMAQFVGRFGSRRYTDAVGYDDGTFEVRVPAQYEPGSELVFEGRVDGERLSGQTRIDDGEWHQWTGVRAPALGHTSVASWGDPIALIGDGLAGWQPRFPQHDGCWQSVEGVLSATPPCVDIVSEARFDDFRLQLEFRYPPGSNSGVYLRGRYEVQIQDDRGMAVDPLRIGGLYGFIAPSVNAARAPNEWQTLDVELIGRRLTVTLNGVEVIAGKEIPGITGGALDSDEGSAGPLMLQGDHGPIEYRNIVVTPGR